MFPNLMTPDPLLDTHETMTFPVTKNNPYPSTVVIRNNPSILRLAREVEEGSRQEAFVVDEVES